MEFIIYDVTRRELRMLKKNKIPVVSYDEANQIASIDGENGPDAYDRAMELLTKARSHKIW